MTWFSLFDSNFIADNRSVRSCLERCPDLLTSFDEFCLFLKVLCCTQSFDYNRLISFRDCSSDRP